jgi:hypothetical protein
MTETTRLCFNCGKSYCLATIFEKPSRCISHPVPLYWRHEVVSWDGGGDSWDYKGFPCCGQNPDTTFEEGCLDTVHMDRLDTVAEDYNWDVFPKRIEYLPPWPEHTTYVRTLRVSEEETDESQREQDEDDTNSGWRQPSQGSMCSNCYHHVCICGDDSIIFEFDERDLRVR